MRPQVTIANFYSIWPVIHGGQRRIYFLARELSRTYDVKLLTLTHDRQYHCVNLGHCLQEIQVPADNAYRTLELAVHRRVKMSGDLAYTLHWEKCTTYQSVLHHSLKAASVIVTAHPYSLHAIEAALGPSSKPIIYDSQNVERRQKKEVLAGYPEGYQAIIDIEGKCLSHCARVLACAESDIDAFREDYGISADRCDLIPNGADILNVPQLSAAQRLRYRERMGFQERFVCVFAGSYHFPNLTAADRVVELATRVNECLFIVFGSVSDYVAAKGPLPPNVLLLGTLSESEKWLLLGACDVGLNPMELGSGSNIKMFEYAAAKLPILSTAFGARGSSFCPSEDFFLADIDDFGERLSTLRDLGEQDLRCVGENAYHKAVEHFDWTRIGAKYSDIIGQVLACQADRSTDGGA